MIRKIFNSPHVLWQTPDTEFARTNLGVLIGPVSDEEWARINRARDLGLEAV